MQIITSKKNFVDNRQRIDYISGILKFTAKRLNCGILTLSQLTRAGKDKPTMSDLKESSGQRLFFFLRSAQFISGFYFNYYCVNINIFLSIDI